MAGLRRTGKWLPRRLMPVHGAVTVAAMTPGAVQVSSGGDLAADQGDRLRQGQLDLSVVGSSGQSAQSWSP